MSYANSRVPEPRLLRGDKASIPRTMTRFFDMDDRARLPWRFFGATMAVLARLS